MPAAVIRVTRSRDAAGDVVVRLRVPLLDQYLEFLGGRCRPNTVLAVAYDLEVFFTTMKKTPRRVRPAYVPAFMTAQRTGGRGRLQVARSGAGVSARTLRRRLSSVSRLYGFLHARGDVAVNRVPRGLPSRRDRQRSGQGVPLVRSSRMLPRILEPTKVDALTAALRTHRDRAMVAAMVLGGLRRCEVLGLRLGDARFAERRAFIAAKATSGASPNTSTRCSATRSPSSERPSAGCCATPRRNAPTWSTPGCHREHYGPQQQRSAEPSNRCPKSQRRAVIAARQDSTPRRGRSIHKQGKGAHQRAPVAR
jgi:Phage integrase, N-terminal SAM-like domain